MSFQVIDCIDLAVSLRQYCAAERLEGDSAYQCDCCGGKRVALRSTVLKKLPPILTFSCNRFRIDKTTNWTRQKVLTKSMYPLVINMDVFKKDGIISSASTIYKNSEEENNFLNLLRESMIWINDVEVVARSIVNRLVEKYGVDFDLSLLSESEMKDIQIEMKAVELMSKNKGSELSSSSSSSSSSSISKAEVLSSSSSKNTRFQGDSTTDNSSNNNSSNNNSSNNNSSNNNSSNSNISCSDTIGSDQYQLFAVVMHRGSAYSGHYFAYIRDRYSLTSLR